MHLMTELAAGPVIADAEFALFRHLIHKQTGIALRESKRSLVASRLAPRLRALQLKSYSQYWEYLRNGDDAGTELQHLVNCITTNKTSFFREPAHYPVLARHMLTAAQAGRKTYRIWSAACSTGEEPYSIAMTAHGAVGAAALTMHLDISILATDIDSEVLQRASAGIYPIDSIADLDDAHKRKFFLRGREESNGFVRVKPAIRQLVAFQPINLIHDVWPVHSRFDAIFCRNVVIYFNRETQLRLFQRLSEYLVPDGLLFVGATETLYWLEELFAPVCHSVYRPRLACNRATT